MFLGQVYISAVIHTFKLRPSSLYPVCGGVTIAILMSAVVYIIAFVNSPNLVIGSVFVRKQDCVRFYKSEYQGWKSFSSGVLGYFCHQQTTSFYYTYDSSFILMGTTLRMFDFLVPMTVLIPPTDIGFVRFHFTLQCWFVSEVHLPSYLLEHVPSRLLCYTYMACQLIGWNTFLVIGNVPYGRKPVTQTDFCLFKHCPCTDGKVLTCVLASIIAVFQLIDLWGLVKRWNRFTMPINGFKMSDTTFLIGKEFI